MTQSCDVPEVALLKTFKGIGDKSAIGLLIEIQTVKRFARAKNLASFFGLHPVLNKAETRPRVSKMSKQGRVEPRHILYMVTLASLKCNPLIQKLYEKHLRKTQHCNHGYLYAQNPADYLRYAQAQQTVCPMIDMANMRRSVRASKETPGKDTSRRFQNDEKAPVSRRQKKRRLEQDRSQSVNDTQNVILNPFQWVLS